MMKIDPIGKWCPHPDRCVSHRVRIAMNTDGLIAFRKIAPTFNMHVEQTTKENRSDIPHTCSTCLFNMQQKKIAPTFHMPVQHACCSIYIVYWNSSAV